jgi:hypothetical protein
MKSKTSRFALSAIAAAVVAACSTAMSPPPPNTLMAVRAAAAPVLDGVAGDAAWASAPALTVKLEDGANFGGKGETTVTLKAVVTGDTLYMLMQYADPTHSVRRAPYQKQADGSWKKLSDPNDKGGDNNVYYEDKWAMIWNINNSIKDFNTKGCAVACHAGEGKPFGNKYTATEGEVGDIWHAKTMRTMPYGRVDDQWLDHTRYDKQKSPGAGRKSDPGGPEYRAFPLVNGKPEAMSPDGKPGNAGGNYFIVKGTEVAFDEARFKPGDEVASHYSLPTSGDRADISLRGRWADGVWTYEFSRKLVTGSKLDVQFDDLAKSYFFGVAAFDNAQVRHAVHYDALTLRFAK